MMATYAVIQNGIVANVVEWDGVSQWTQPAGDAVVLIPGGTFAGIGSTYANGAFGAPPQTPCP